MADAQVTGNRLSIRKRAEQARRRGRDAGSARQAILAAAEEAFANQGFDGARVDAIAEASGYNKALLFHYFGDKLGLYREVVFLRRDETDGCIGEMLLEAAGDPSIPLDRARVQAFIEQVSGWMFDHFAERPRVLRIFAWEIASGWESFLAAKRENPHAFKWVGPALDFIHRAQEQGIIHRDLDPKMIVIHIMSMTTIYLLSIPRYEMLFHNEDLTAPEAMAHAREQMVRLAVHAVMTSPQEI
ncbi:MAG TPA: TetR family transcriptional regulator [Ktedonobacterales bacterium]|nr:TetR family transcriptional regulator [Ktedonobacterales bacterium]